MTRVNTVLGPVDSSALGRTRMHEHIIVRFPGSELDPLRAFDQEKAANEAVGHLKALKSKGVSTLVDAASITHGRCADFLEMVAEMVGASGMNIIAATGFFNRSFGLPDYFAAMDVDGLAAIMEHEIKTGIKGTNIRAGIIKVATGADKIRGSEERVLRAAARVSRSAGVPIITHTHRGTLGAEQLDILENEGANLGRVVIGHMDGSSDIRSHLDIVRRGACVGFDQIGWDHFQSDEVRLAAVAGLISAGYGGRIVLSQDYTIIRAGRPPLKLFEGYNRELTYLDDEFIPRLVKGGISPQTIEQILSNNPRRIFEL